MPAGSTLPGNFLQQQTHKHMLHTHLPLFSSFFQIKEKFAFNNTVSKFLKLYMWKRNFFFKKHNALCFLAVKHSRLIISATKEVAKSKPDTQHFLQVQPLFVLVKLTPESLKSES